MKYREIAKKLKALGCEQLPAVAKDRTASGIIQLTERLLPCQIGAQKI